MRRWTTTPRRSPTRTWNPRCSWSTRWTRRGAPGRPGLLQPLRHRRLRDARGDRAARPGAGRGERGPEVVLGRVLPAALRGAPRPGARGAGGVSARRHLAGSHDAGHPRRERRSRRAPRADRLAGRASRAGDALAREPLLPRLPDAGRAADADRDHPACGRDRPGGRAARTCTSATPRSWAWRTRTARGAARC